MPSLSVSLHHDLAVINALSSEVLVWEFTLQPPRGHSVPANDADDSVQKQQLGHEAWLSSRGVEHIKKVCTWGRRTNERTPRKRPFTPDHAS